MIWPLLRERAVLSPAMRAAAADARGADEPNGAEVGDETWDAEGFGWTGTDHSWRQRTRTLPSGAVVDDVFKNVNAPPPPKLYGRKARAPGVFRLYLQRVDIWISRVKRALPPEDRGPALIDGLDDEALLEMQELDGNKLASAEGAQYLIDGLRAIYAQRPVVRMGELLEEFFERSTIEPGEHTQAFCHRLQMRAGRLGKEVNVDLPDEVKTYYLLKGLRLSPTQRAQILSAAGSQYSFRPVVSALGILYPTTIPTQQLPPHRKFVPPPRPFQSRFGKGDGRSGQGVQRPHQAHEAAEAEYEDEEVVEDGGPQEDTPSEGNPGEEEPEEVTQEVHAAQQHFMRAKQRMKKRDPGTWLFPWSREEREDVATAFVQS